MLPVLQLGLTNSIVASLLAVTSWIVARSMRAPALAHMLCVTALLKLVALPALVFSFHWPLSQSGWQPPIWLLIALGTVWFGGSAFWFITQLRVALRLREAFKCARTAPVEVLYLSRRAARRLHLRRWPPTNALRNRIPSPLRLLESYHHTTGTAAG